MLTTHEPVGGRPVAFLLALSLLVGVVGAHGHLEQLQSAETSSTRSGSASDANAVCWACALAWVPAAGAVKLLDAERPVTTRSVRADTPLVEFRHPRPTPPRAPPAWSDPARVVRA